VGRLRAALGIRLVDVGATVIVAVVVELNVATGGGAGSHPLNALAYVLGGILAVPVLFRQKWPLQVLIACSALLFIYYVSGFRRNISPAPLLSLPLYDAALAGYLAVTIVIPVFYLAVGLLVVDATTHEGLVTLASDFLPQAVVLALAIMLGEVVRSRRALAAETADRLRLAAEERESETARRVAEERLRIARELHDTVAHSMATITVQAGSALHVLGESAAPDAGHAGGSSAVGSSTDAGLADAARAGPRVRDALIAIRETSKSALADMRMTLGQLRTGGGGLDAPELRSAGLERLSALSDAVRAAGAAVSVTIEGEQVPLPPGIDHAAYRILQESLTNVLRHAGPDARATVCLRFAPDALTIRVTDDGIGPSGGNASGLAAGGGTAAGGAAGGPDAGNGAGPDGAARSGGGGHGLDGMSERAASVGGQLSAGPGDSGGFEVVARLPVAPAAPAKPAPSATPATSAKPAPSTAPAGPAG
jgi:signal transduction histidine kinase